MKAAKIAFALGCACLLGLGALYLSVRARTGSGEPAFVVVESGDGGLSTITGYDANLVPVAATSLPESGLSGGTDADVSDGTAYAFIRGASGRLDGHELVSVEGGTLATAITDLSRDALTDVASDGETHLTASGSTVTLHRANGATLATTTLPDDRVSSVFLVDGTPFATAEDGDITYLYRFDRSLQITDKLLAATAGASVGGHATMGDNVYLTHTDGSGKGALLAYNLTSHHLTSIDLPAGHARGVLSTGDKLLVTHYDAAGTSGGGSVSEVDPATGEKRNTRVAVTPEHAAVSDGRLLVVDSDKNAVVYDAPTMRVTAKSSLDNIANGSLAVSATFGTR